MKIIKDSQQFLTKHEMHKLLSNIKTKGEENEETIKYLMKEYCKEEKDTSDLRNEFINKGLYPFEVYQLINFMPKDLLTLQLIIEEMEERFTEEDLNYILELFKK